MKFSLLAAAISLSAPLVRAVAVPEAGADVAQSFTRSERSEASKRDADIVGAIFDPIQRLFKRRGGGGGGGRGGGSSSSGSGRGSSSSGSSSGRGGSSSSSGSSGSSSSSSGKSNPKSSGRGSSSSNTGGRTTTGSGVSPSYGGGKFYGGGASQPYSSGTKSPSGILPVAVGAYAGYQLSTVHFWPGFWYHPIYYYPYYHPYNYYNRSSGRNETKNVACACDETVECGCDDNSNSTEYMNEVIGSGAYSTFSPSNTTSLVSLGEVNGTQTVLINGTLANGTTASGGDESASAAGDSMRALLQNAGWWPVAATMLAMAYAL